MKIIMTIILAGFANCAFALTKTIDGITWYYSVETDGGISLEYPGIRTSISEHPSVCQGRLPQVLNIPEMIDGCVITSIGASAFQVPEDNDLNLVVVPKTVTRISNRAFLGDYIRKETIEQGSYYASYWTKIYRYYYNHWSNAAAPILFLGDIPDVSDDESWRWSHDPEFVVVNWMISGTYPSGVEKREDDQFANCDLYVVEGMQGWSAGDSFCGGTVKYGAAKVEYSLQGGIVAKGSRVMLTCPNASAQIYYTLDGSEPQTRETSSCFLYNGPIELQASVTVKALACVAAYPYTVTYSQAYAFGQTHMPVIASSIGNVFYQSGNMVTLSTETGDAEIRYTLDGSEPTESSMLYTGPFAIDDTTTVKAKAFKEDWFESETATATFTREWYTVETPVIAPCDATFANASQEVTISCTTEGATILYTTDGSDPLAEGREYKRPFTVYKSCVVRAVALKHDWKNSAESTSALTRGEALSEAANFYGYKMETGTDAPWVVDTEMSHDGVSSVRSGGDGSYLQVSVRGAGTLSFWWRAMCEEPGYEYYDYGCVKMGSDIIGRIAGEDTGWEFFSTKVASTAKHVFRWEYHKDDEGTYEPDCIWVDRVQWIPADGSGYTLTTPEPVPYSWLDEYRLGVGTDYETAGNAASGKMQGGKALHVWQDYVAGTDPTNLESRLEANIEMRDGRPFVWWMPNLNEGGANARVYTVWGKTNLTDRVWHSPTNEASRFFKVTVEMP